MAISLKRQQATVADDTTLSITGNNANIIAIDNQGVGYGVLFFADYDSGNVTKLSDPGDWCANSDTDNKVCLFTTQNSNTHTFKNRSGASYGFEFRNLG